MSQQNLNENLITYAKAGDAGRVRDLLSQGANALFEDSRALRSAAEHGHAKCVELLLPTSNPLAYGSHALQLAAYDGHFDCVKLLLPLSNPLSDHSLALRWAAENGHVECVKFLLPVSDPSDEDFSALTMAARYGHLECVKLLLPFSPPLTGNELSFAHAISSGKIEAFKLLLSSCGPFASEPEALLWAAEAPDSECAALLSSLYETTNRAPGILTAAIAQGSPATVSLLLNIEPFRKNCRLHEIREQFLHDSDARATLAALDAFIDAEELAEATPAAAKSLASSRL